MKYNLLATYLLVNCFLYSVRVLVVAMCVFYVKTMIQYLILASYYRTEEIFLTSYS